MSDRLKISLILATGAMCGFLALRNEVDTYLGWQSYLSSWVTWAHEVSRQVISNIR